LQGAATWRIQCGDPRVFIHLFKNFHGDRCNRFPSNIANKTCLQSNRATNKLTKKTNKQAQATESNTSGEVIIVKAALLVIEFLFALFLTLQQNKQVSYR